MVSRILFSCKRYSLVNTKQMHVNEWFDRIMRASSTPLRGLDAPLSKKSQEILACYDACHHEKQRAESKVLADGGSLTTSGMALPSVFGRAVVRNVVADLAILESMQIATDAAGQTHLPILHMQRKGYKGHRHGLVFDGKGIPFLNIEQNYEIGALQSVKLAISVSDEVLFFNAGRRDIDVMATFITYASEEFREILVRRAADAMVRAADSWGASAVINENIAAQLDGSGSLIKTANFPVVRPYQARSLDGIAVGGEENPIDIIIDGSSIPEIDPTIVQPTPGVYWRAENLSLGLIRLVDEADNPVTPNVTTATISYSQSTNAALFDTKLPDGASLGSHLDGAITAISAAKKAIFDRAHLSATYCTMPETLADRLTDASYFSGDPARTEGLKNLKSMIVHAINVADTDLGAERVLIGVADTATYAVASPVSFAAPFQRQGSPGKHTYGIELSGIFVPAEIRNRLSSVILYDSDARTAAV